MKLYQRWQSIATEFSHQLALVDWRTGRHWSFLQLQEQVDQREKIQAGQIVFSNAWSIELIIDTLVAWRDSAILCPVENDSPSLALFSKLPDDIIHIKISSGSTATPKLILFKSSQLAADADNIVATMGLKPEWPNIGVISMAHSYGFSNLVLPLLLHGIPLIWTGNPFPALLSAIFESENEKQYTLAAVPAMWRAWLQAGVLNANQIKLAISAGAPLSLELENDLFHQHGIKLHNFYGSSECGGIAYDRTELPRHDRSYVGCAMNNVSLELHPDNAILTVKSAAVGESYWPLKGDASCESETLVNGRFTTADCAKFDASTKQLFLLDRHSDIINVAGRKVAPGKIEQAILLANPEIDHCLVFGIPSKDPERVEEVVACIACSEEFGEQVQQNTQSNARLKNYEMPRHWHFSNDLKPNARGKISRKEWREKYLSSPRSK